MNTATTDQPATIVFPTLDIDETLRFYRALGFEALFEMRDPYPWLTLQRGGLLLEFTRLRGYTPEQAYTFGIVMVADVQPLHRAFVEGLRGAYGALPVAGLPRITRLRSDGTRIKVVDLAGNTLLFISRDESPADYEDAEAEHRSPLMQALHTAVWLRDMKGHDDPAAAKVLDIALKRHGGADAPALELARVLAARAELALALGQRENVDALREQLRALPLSEAGRTLYAEELQAVDALERLLE